MTTPQNEIEKIIPQVNVSGELVDDLHCLRVTQRTGIQSSTCDLSYSPLQDQIGPRTLTNGGDYEHRQRVLVYTQSKSKIWFQGWLTKRQDQHKQNTTIWSCEDDRLVLKNAYVRGCFILDNLLDRTHELKYVPSRNAVFNPKGAWNCTFATIGGVKYPVFAPTALVAQAYASPDQFFDVDGEEGEIQPWTCRRILRYLRLVMHFNTINGSELSSMQQDPYVSINEDLISLSNSTILNMDGIDIGIKDASKDPLDAMCEAITLQGDTILGALIKVLKVAGTHELVMNYDLDKIKPVQGMTTGRTNVGFKPVGYAAEGQNIGIQFGGNPDTSLGRIFDFSLSEDSSDTYDRVLVEGKTSNVETQLEYTGDIETSTIVPAWSQAEQDSYLRCVYGNADLTGFVGKYALMPKISGKASDKAEDYQAADGTNGTNVVGAMDTEAANLAQQSFPTVFRAYTIRTTYLLQQLLGGDDELIHPRPILPQQLQFLSWRSDELENPKLGDTQLRANLPIRVQVSPDPYDDKYYDVGRDVTMRITGDEQGQNLIWLDGLGVAIDGHIACLYGPGFIRDHLVIKNGDVEVRKFKINLAVPTSRRTKGQATLAGGDTYNEGKSYLSSDFADAFDLIKSPYKYLDVPQSYRTDRQSNSYPAANIKYYGGADGGEELELPLNRFLPPGDESKNAEYAAERELSRSRRPVRDSSFRIGGIYSTLLAGDWISNIYVFDENGDRELYSIESMAKTIVLDFAKQETNINNVFGDIDSFQI